MALKAGRVGLNKDLVDEFGYLKEDAPSGEYYTKTQADNKFETKTHVNNNFQKKTLEVPIELLSGSALTVESALQGLNEEKQNMTLEVPIELLSGSALTVESALQGLNEEKFERAEQVVLGARNIFNPYMPWAGSSSAVQTILDNGQSINISSETEGTYRNRYVKIKVVPNTDYKVSADVVITNGVGELAIADDTDVMIVSSQGITTNQSVSLTFNSGNNTILRVKLSCSLGTGAVGNVTYNNLLVTLATDSDSTWTPCALTNRELTDNFSEIDGSSGVTSTGTLVNEYLILKRIGREVFCQLRVNGTFSAGDTLALLPEGFRPTKKTVTSAGNISSKGLVYVDINTYGVISCGGEAVSNENFTLLYTSWILD